MTTPVDIATLLERYSAACVWYGVCYSARSERRAAEEAYCLAQDLSTQGTADGWDAIVAHWRDTLDLLDRQKGQPT